MAGLKLAIPTKQSTTPPKGLSAKDARQVASGTRSATHARRALLGTTNPLSGKLTQPKETADQRLTNQNIKYLKSLPVSKQKALGIKRAVQSVANNAANNKATAKTRSDAILGALSQSPIGTITKKLGLGDIPSGINRIILGTIGNTAERAVHAPQKLPGDLLHAAKDEMLPGAVGTAGGIIHAGSDLATGHPRSAVKDVKKLAHETGKSASQEFGALYRGDAHAYQKQRAKFQKGEGGMDILSVLPIPAKIIGEGLGAAGRTLKVKAVTKERPNVMMAGESAPKPQPLSTNAFTIAKQRATDAARAKNAKIGTTAKHGKRPAVAAAEAHPNTVPTITSVRAPKVSGQKVTKNVARLYSSAVIQSKSLIHNEITGKGGLVHAVKDLPLAHRRGVAAGMALGIREATTEPQARAVIQSYIDHTKASVAKNIIASEKRLDKALKTSDPVRIRNAQQASNHAKMSLHESVDVVKHFEDMLAHPQGVKGGHFPAGIDATINQEVSRSQRIAERSMPKEQGNLGAVAMQEHAFGLTPDVKVIKRLDKAISKTRTSLKGAHARLEDAINAGRPTEGIQATIEKHQSVLNHLIAGKPTAESRVAAVTRHAEANGLNPGGYLSAMKHPDEMVHEAGGVNAAQIPKAEPKRSTGTNVSLGRVYLDPLTNARALAADLRHSARGRVEETLRLQNRMTDFVDANGNHVHLGDEGFSNRSDANQAIQDAGLDHTQVTPFAHRQWINGKQVQTWHILNADADESIRKVFSPSNNKLARAVRAVLSGLPAVAILGTSPGWLPAQIAANVIQVAAATPDAFLHLVENRKLYKAGSPESQAIIDSIGGHGDSFDRLAHPDNFLKAKDQYTALDKFWQNAITKGIRKRASDPVGLFWADHKQNGFFRRLVATNELRKRLEHMDGLAADIYNINGRLDEFTRKFDIGANIHRSPETAAADYLQVVKHGEQIAEKVRKWLGDYTAYTPAERAILKNNVMFYGYLRHSLRTVVYTLGVQHPAVASIMAGLGGLHAQEVKDLLGQDATPQMIAKYYLNKDASSAFDIRRSAVLLNTLTDFTSSKPTQVLNSISPLLGAAIQASTGVDAFTGKPIIVTDPVTGLRRPATGGKDFWKIFSSKLINTVSALRVADKYSNPNTKIDFKNKQILAKTGESTIFSPAYSKVAKAPEQLSRIQEVQKANKPSFLQAAQSEVFPFTKHGLTDKSQVQRNTLGDLKSRVTAVKTGAKNLSEPQTEVFIKYLASHKTTKDMSASQRIGVLEDALKEAHSG